MKLNPNKIFLQRISRGELEQAQVSLGLGADVNIVGPGGYTPIFIAAMRGDLAMVEWLLSKGANPNKPIDAGDTPLGKAAELGHEAVIAPLVKAGAVVDGRDKNGLTPLLVAVAAGGKKAVAVAKRLIALGADMNAVKEDTRTTPLMEAANRGDVEMIKLLVGAGADQLRRDSFGNTALMYVAGAQVDLKKAKICLSLLLREDTLELKASNGSTALSYAITCDRPWVAEQLINAGANVLHVVDGEEQNQLQLLREHYDPEMFELALEVEERMERAAAAERQARLESVVADTAPAPRKRAGARL